MSVVDDIKSRLDIADIVSGYVELKKSGQYLKAICPFHTEKTPSFIVNLDRQNWRCFGACATGGDVFSFVMRIEGLDFGTVLRNLAQRTGVALSRTGDSDSYRDIHNINKIAVQFYQDVLMSSDGKHAIRYLNDRGINKETIDKFQLGFSSRGWSDLKSQLNKMGFTDEQAIQAGLLRRNEDGTTRDFFRERVMFPICDRQTNVIGFGARVLDDTLPKYINTAGTLVFDKRSNLYAFHMTSEFIKTQNSGIVVEGYMDVLTAHQYGYRNVVASMGTALTKQQVSTLESLASNFVLALDPDVAGQEATLRSLDASWGVFDRELARETRSGLGSLYQKKSQVLRIAALPSGCDPDRLIREDSDKWKQLITEDALPYRDFFISILDSKFDLNTTKGKGQAVEFFAPLISSANFVEQEPYIRKLANKLSVSENAIKSSIGRPKQSGYTRTRRTYKSSKAMEVTLSTLVDKPEDSLEDYTLALLLKTPNLKERAAGLDPQYFHRIENREIFTHWMNCPTMEELQEKLEDPLVNHMAFIMEKDMVASGIRTAEIALDQCLKRLERRHLKELQEGLLVSEDFGTPPSKTVEDSVSNLNSRLKDLFS